MLSCAFLSDWVFFCLNGENESPARPFWSLLIYKTGGGLNAWGFDHLKSLHVELHVVWFPGCIQNVCNLGRRPTCCCNSLHPFQEYSTYYHSPYVAAVSVGDYVALYAMKSHAVMVDFLAAKVRWFSDRHTCDPSCSRMYGF